MKMKKFLSVMLAIAMTCSLCTSAMAYHGGETEGSVAIGDEYDPIMPLLVSEAFNVTLDGNSSLDKTIVLGGDYRYFIIEIKNEGNNDIHVEVNGESYVAPVGNSKYYIHSTNKWPEGSFQVGFSSDSPSKTMKGWAICRIATTLDEVKFPWM